MPALFFEMYEGLHKIQADVHVRLCDDIRRHTVTKVMKKTTQARISLNKIKNRLIRFFVYRLSIALMVACAFCTTGSLRYIDEVSVCVISIGIRSARAKPRPRTEYALDLRLERSSHVLDVRIPASPKVGTRTHFMSSPFGR